MKVIKVIPKGWECVSLSLQIKTWNKKKSRMKNYVTFFVSNIAYVFCVETEVIFVT